MSESNKLCSLVLESFREEKFLTSQSCHFSVAIRIPEMSKAKLKQINFFRLRFFIYYLRHHMREEGFGRRRVGGGGGEVNTKIRWMTSMEGVGGGYGARVGEEESHS